MQAELPDSSGTRRRQRRGSIGATEHFSNWYEATSQRPRANSIALPEVEAPRRRSIIHDDSIRGKGSVGEVAAIALHGAQQVRNNHQTFIQHLSSAVAMAAPPAKLDTVQFSVADRVAAWLTGTGRELRLLKEAHLADAPQADGSTAPVPRLKRLRNLALVLLGAEESAIDRGVGSLDGELFGASPPALVAGMVDLQRKAHVDAAVYSMSRAHKADAADIVGTVDDFLPAYPLSFWEKLYLRWGGGDFTDDEKAVLLGTVPAAAIAEARRQQARREVSEQRPRLSIADISEMAAPTARASSGGRTASAAAAAPTTPARRAIGTWHAAGNNLTVSVAASASAVASSISPALSSAGRSALERASGSRSATPNAVRSPACSCDASHQVSFASRI